VEETGGLIHMDRLPVGDPTLSAKELIGNESQERMGLIMAPGDMDLLGRIAARERAPMYEVGEVTGDHRFTFVSDSSGERPMDLELAEMFGSSPKTIMTDRTVAYAYRAADYATDKFTEYLKQVLQLEAVACKDWLTNKVDRCVGGRVAKQQCAGPLQLPLNNCGVMALDFKGREGIATSVGHSPVSSLIDPVAGSRNSIVEALTNIIWAPLKDGLKAVSLSANWMWPCNNEGEDARLYKAVVAVSEFAIELGINVPTGKDSLSMKQKYRDKEVIAPGTVIISAAAHCDDITAVIEPVLKKNAGDIFYIGLSGDSFKLGGSSLAQILNTVGDEAPGIRDSGTVISVFGAVQELIRKGKLVAGHDVASGGLITTLLELCFADIGLGADLDLTGLGEPDTIKLLFAENAGIVVQAADESAENHLRAAGIQVSRLGRVNATGKISLVNAGDKLELSVDELRDVWYKAQGLAKKRFENYKVQPLHYNFPSGFTGMADKTLTGKPGKPRAAILREKGSNSEREMANAMYLAGFEVRDVHMTDLIAGRETLEDIQFIGAVGGFSNSDVLGSAKGWAGAFKYNEKANSALEKFFARPDTLSVGICNGCQLFMELELINPEHSVHGKLTYNDSHKHESGFTSVKIGKNKSVMLSTLEGCTLGVWISHGEGKFNLPLRENEYDIVAKYGYEGYPANPNGSDYNTAMMCDSSGRHLVTMPHIERSIFPWNWASYPEGRRDEVSPWLTAFLNARKWVEQHRP
jgi:phosphoribosylformylglycinamidine synthase